jgi:hypothetical protein
MTCLSAYPSLSYLFKLLVRPKTFIFWSIYIDHDHITYHQKHCLIKLQHSVHKLLRFPILKRNGINSNYKIERDRDQQVDFICA